MVQGRGDMMGRVNGRHRGFIFAAAGFSLLLIAPMLWALLRLLLVYEPGAPLVAQMLADVTRSPEQMLLYAFMGGGAALLASTAGFILGKTGDQLRERAAELETLHGEVSVQKELFESRYRALDDNIRKFQRINTRIQKSLDVREVMALCAEGLHDVLGFERVNILMADSERKVLNFLMATGSEDFDPAGVILPLDHRIGVIYKCFTEQKLYLVDDIGRCPQDYYLHAPYDVIKPLRSRSFVLCPIVVRGETVGLFGIDNAYSRRLANESDEDTIRLFADQAAAAITRIELLKAIDALTSELDNTFADFLRKRETYGQTFHTLRASIDSLFDGTSRIVHASESVLSSVEDTSSAVGEISVSIDQVTNNLNFLAEAIDKSVSAMEEMHASIRNVEKNAAFSHEVSRQVTEQADRGKDGVCETIASLEAIQQSVDLSYEGIMRLSENSGRIGTIVKVIRDITKKTNLLALNASIIAAQAGEYGKNFGVVAGEMRNLSQQTGRSAGEIAGIVAAIFEDSGTAARTITSSRELVQRGVALGRTTGENLNSILDSAHRSLDMTEEIKTATEEQVRGVQFISRSIEDVSAMAAQIFNAAKEQSGATKNIMRSIESIKDMALNMVKATEAQVRDGSEIEASATCHEQTSEEIFDSMEQRRRQSIAVMEQLAGIKDVQP